MHEAQISVNDSFEPWYLAVTDPSSPNSAGEICCLRNSHVSNSIGRGFHHDLFGELVRSGEASLYSSFLMYIMVEALVIPIRLVIIISIWIPLPLPLALMMPLA